MAPWEKFDLSGKTALVTGGATGLGYHMTRALARSGAKVMIAARRQAVLEEAAHELMKQEDIGAILCRSVDLADRASIDALAAHAIAEMGKVDILVGNAGIVNAELIPDITVKATDELFQVNFAANVALAQALLPGMQERRWGRVLFSSSTAADLSAPHQGNIMYAATKAGLNSFARAIATDMGHFNITANAIVLGFFKTPIMAEAEQQLIAAQGAEAARAFFAAFTDMMALGRMGDPAEIEGIVQLLCSDAGSYITGASIPVDGGMSIMMRGAPSAA